MSLDEIKEKYHGGKDQAIEAFEELCGLVENLHVSYNKNKLHEVPIGVLLKRYWKSVRYELFHFLHFKVEREERKEAATARLNHLKDIIVRLREKNQTLKGKYVALLDQ